MTDVGEFAASEVWVISDWQKCLPPRQSVFVLAERTRTKRNEWKPPIGPEFNLGFKILYKRWCSKERFRVCCTKDTLTCLMGFINDWSSAGTIRCSLFLSPLFVGSKESQLSFGKSFEEHQRSNLAVITYLSIVVIQKLRNESWRERISFLGSPDLSCQSGYSLATHSNNLMTNIAISESAFHLHEPSMMLCFKLYLQSKQVKRSRR